MYPNLVHLLVNKLDNPYKNSPHSLTWHVLSMSLIREQHLITYHVQRATIGVFGVYLRVLYLACRKVDRRVTLDESNGGGALPWLENGG
jgi:hypothetical protein